MNESLIEVTELEAKLLEVLRANGDWMTRRQVAQALGRPGILTPYDVELLEKLAAADLVEITQRPTGPVRKVWSYRAK